MQAYVEQRMELPPGGIKMAMPMTAPGIMLRNLSTRMMTSRPFRPLLAKVAAGNPDQISLAAYQVLATPARPS